MLASVSQWSLPDVFENVVVLVLLREREKDDSMRVSRLELRKVVWKEASVWTRNVRNTLPRRTMCMQKVIADVVSVRKTEGEGDVVLAKGKFALRLGLRQIFGLWCAQVRGKVPHRILSSLRASFVLSLRNNQVAIFFLWFFCFKLFVLKVSKFGLLGCVAKVFWRLSKVVAMWPCMLVAVSRG